MNGKILIIDDEFEYRELTKQYLDGLGYNVCAASNGQEGLRLAKEEAVDLVLTDISMPEMDGIALIREIKEFDDTIPVIVMSGYPTFDFAVDAFREYGAFDFLPKPVPLEDVNAAIEKGLLQRQQKRDGHQYLESLHHSVDFLDLGVVLLNNRGKIVFWNKWVEQKSKQQLQSSRGKSLDELFPTLKDGRIMKAVEACFSANMTKRISNRLIDVPFPFYRDEVDAEAGKPMDQIVLVRPINLENQSRYCLINISDASKAFQREKKLKQTTNDLIQIKKQEEYIRAVFENTADAIVTISGDGFIEDLNSPGEKVFDLSRKQIINHHIAELVKEFKIDAPFQEQLQRLRIVLDQASELHGLKNKIVFPIEFSLGKMKGLNTFVAIIRDITERKRSQEELIRLAQYDSLTNLSNRVAFLQHLDNAIRRSKRNNSKIAIIFMDLDNFKTINETLGHDVGDELLKHVARKLETVLRESDFISRIGGDEFTVVLDNVSNEDHVAYVAEKIISTLAEEKTLMGHSFTVSSSIGIALFPRDGEDHNTLIKNADTAMYHAKTNGRGQFSFFSKDMNYKVQRRMEIEHRLRHAVERNELVMFFQPQISIHQNKVIGCEALIRWRDGDGGFIPPFEFIPIAEETALILEIGQWVIRDSLKNLKVINQLGHRMKMGINISPRQFRDPSLVAVIQEAIAQNNIDPEEVVIEITESHVMENADKSIECLNSLKETAIRIALDDFGVEYSSLNYLRLLPIDILKIDRAFINDIDRSQVACNILDTIIGLAHVLKMEVLAEGVENLKQLNLLKDTECDVLQGYYYSKPLPFDEFVKFMETF